MSLPMPSGSCWTKRTTESNRTAPEILRGFFAPYPPADASCRTSGHTPPNPLTAGLPVTQAQTRTTQPPNPLSSLSLTPHSRTSLLSKPCFPQSEARHAPHFPTTQALTHTPQPSSPLSSPLTNSPILAGLSSPTPAPKAKPNMPHAFPPRRRRAARPSRPARYLPRH